MKTILLDNITKKESKIRTELEYFKTENSFVFIFDCYDSKMFSAFDEDNADLFWGDVAEVFIRTGKKENEYYEIELAPNGRKFFALVKFFGEDGLDISFLDVGLLKTQIIPQKSGYKAIIEIPFGSVGYTADDDAFFNAYRIETEGGVPEKNLLALFPTTTGKFHDPSVFRKI